MTPPLQEIKRIHYPALSKVAVDNNNSHCNFKRQKCDQERSQKYLQNKDLPIATWHMWNVKTKLIPVIRGATGTVYKLFIKCVNNVCGKYIRELQETAILGTTCIF
jgi:hypothetical protein